MFHIRNIVIIKVRKKRGMTPLLVLSAEILSAISAVKNRPTLIDNALETNKSNNIQKKVRKAVADIFCDYAFSIC